MMEQDLPLYKVMDIAAALYLQEPDEGSDQERQEYFDLFFVPVSGRYLPPFESAQREQRLWGSNTYHAAAIYQAVGFTLASLSFSPHWGTILAPDHIGVELAFASSLLRQCEQAGKAQRKDLERLLKHFAQQHLLSWQDEYGRSVAEKAKTDRYVSLGHLTQGIMEETASRYL